MHRIYEILHKIENFLKGTWAIIGIAILGLIIAESLGLGIATGGAVAYKRATADKASLIKRLFITTLGGIAGGIIMYVLDLFLSSVGSIGEIVGNIIGLAITIFIGRKIADFISSKKVI